MRIKPYYWETVFRTNTQSAYIAGGLNVSNPPLNYFDNFKPQQGFGGNPLDTGNWWDLTEGQRRLAEKYGLLKEFENKEKILFYC